MSIRRIKVSTLMIYNSVNFSTNHYPWVRVCGQDIVFLKMNNCVNSRFGIIITSIIMSVYMIYSGGGVFG